MAQSRHVIKAKIVCDKQNTVVYSGMTNELFPSNEQEMNEQDEVLREEERITQEELRNLILAEERDINCSCPQTGFFRAQRIVVKRLKEQGVDLTGLTIY
jgi:hypothetical protein